MFGERYEEFVALWCVRNEDGQERSDEFGRDSVATRGLRGIDSSVSLRHHQARPG